MNISELLIALYLNALHPLKLVAKKHKLSIQQLLCVYAVPINGITQTNLADSLSVDISTLSRNLHKLENQNIIIKKLVKDDNRFVKIFLTDYGTSLLTNILSDLTNYTNHLDIESSDIQSIIDSLLKLNWSILKNRT